MSPEWKAEIEEAGRAHRDGMAPEPAALDVDAAWEQLCEWLVGEGYVVIMDENPEWPR